MTTSRKLVTGWALVITIGIASSGCLDMVVPKDGTITLTLDPQVLDKNSCATITVLALDELGAPVMNGTQVFITTDLGMVLPYDLETACSEYVLPDEAHKVSIGTRNGVAMATFYSGPSKGTATINVRSGDHSETATFTIGRTADKILLSVQGQSGESGSLLPPDGGTVKITAYVYDVDDNPIVGEDVVFSTTEGVLDSGGGRVRTDSDGIAEDNLSTYWTASVSAQLPGSASMAGLLSHDVTITVPEPLVYTVIPGEGHYDGGYRVTITGTSFAYGARVLFDGTPGEYDISAYGNAAPTPTTWNDHQIDVIVPASRFGEPDVVDLIVQNPNDYHYRFDSGFTYNDEL